MHRGNGAVFAVKAWTIKKQGEKFYIAQSIAFAEKPHWSKGYASLQAACAAIARKLAEEWTARNARRRKFYKLAKER